MFTAAARVLALRREACNGVSPAMIAGRLFTVTRVITGMPPAMAGGWVKSMIQGLAIVAEPIGTPTGPVKSTFIGIGGGGGGGAACDGARGRSTASAPRVETIGPEIAPTPQDLRMVKRFIGPLPSP